MYILVKVEELVEKIRRAGWSLFQPMGVAPQTKGAPFMIIKNRTRFKISQKKLSNFKQLSLLPCMINEVILKTHF